MWSSSLHKLAFGQKFDQRIDLVTWPASLEQLLLGGFDRPFHAVEGPASLQELALGKGFKQSLHGIGTWAPHLRELILMASRLSCAHSLAGVDWPPRLQQVYVDKRGDRERDKAYFPDDVKVVYSSW